MGNRKTMVLIVEDDVRQVRRYEEELAQVGFEFMTAFDLTAASDILRRHGDEFGAIILDGCVPGDSVNTIPFITEVNQNRQFNGILVAASNMDVYRAKMVRAGCTHEAPKGEVVALITRELTT